MLVLQDLYFCRSLNRRERGTLANQQKDQKDKVKSEVNVTFVFLKQPAWKKNSDAFSYCCL